MSGILLKRFGRTALLIGVLMSGALTVPAPAHAQISPFMQAVAEAASDDTDIAAFYKSNGYKPIWTGTTDADKARRTALLNALRKAGDHALPLGAYDIERLTTNMRAISSERDLGRVEVQLSKTFLKYARDIQTGVLTPKKVDSGIVRDVPLRDRTELLDGFSKTAPVVFLRALTPKSPEYARLMKAKILLERQLGRGGWGLQVPAKSLAPGDSGDAVVVLRNRLIAMGYMRRSASASYDAELQKAVQLFQDDNGLEPDGVAGPGTMVDINYQIEDRLPNIIVAMERERWMNIPRGKRHVWVNLTDFSAAIIDDDKVTFKTRAVVGKNTSDRRTPEFSDIMEHMVINPTWNVPRSITVKEYLPAMQRNPGAVGHLKLYNSRGQQVSRAGINFSRYNARTFPFNLKQPPSNSNALGLVKFMFPNRYNIYLHDTPAKSLFGREIRDFSHGCVRLNDPFDFAYALLSRQTDDPVGFFQAKLRTRIETRVNLETPIPVHIVYRTAFTSAKGRLNFRRDVYGRDARIFDALISAGVVLGAYPS